MATGWLLAGLLALLAARVNAEPKVEPAAPANAESAVEPAAPTDADEHLPGAAGVPVIAPSGHKHGPPGRPWAAGVSQAEQTTALALYKSGNLEFAESRFAQALAKYREAIQHWDHPAIRFNMAVCLIRFDQPVEAMEELERSLVFGAGPLGPDLYTQGQTYRKLLDAQLAHLQIGCGEPGTQITLDGRYRFTAPGALDKILLPGEHQVVATRAGFVTVTRTLVLVAGKRTHYDVPPLEVRVAAQMVRRWPEWVPWLVLAGGAAAVAGGAQSYVAARANFASYDRGVTTHCSYGCDAATLAGYPDLREHRSRGDTEHVVALSLFAAGGTAIVAGAIGLLFNEPRVQVESGHAQAAVVSLPGGAAISMAWGF
jgi:hypothetical protein